MSLRKLSAMEQLSVKGEALKLLPILLRKGLEPEDALAVAGNAATLYFALGESRPKSVRQVLHDFSLEEILELLDEEWNGWDLNEGFKEDGLC